MRRLRFTSGLILGLIVGGALGTLIGLLWPSTRGADPTAANTALVQDLTRQLEAARESKDRVDRQLEVFAKLADQMSATFKSLEERFTALEEQERARDAREQAARRPPAPPTPPPPPPPPDTPTPAAQPPAAEAPPAAAAPQ